jgi:hypothetical protein
MKYASLVLAFALTACVVNLKNEKTKQNLIHVDVQCTYPGKNQLNTFDGTYKKEIAPSRYAQTDELKFDPGQQLLILNRALVLHFFEMPNALKHSTESDTLTHSLRIKADTLDHTVTWMGSLDGLRPEKYHFKELVEFVDSIAQSTDAYLVLPKAQNEQ